VLDNGVTFVNPVSLNGGGDTRQIAVNNGVGTASGVLSNPLFTGGGGLVKLGGGILVLTGANTYGGSTTINAGVLRANSGVGIPNITNLMLDGGVVESSTNITRPLFTNDTATGQVAIIGTTSGFSAFGAPISVDLGGDGSGTGPVLQWGNGSFNPATLVVNAGSSDSTLTFRNSIDFNGGANRIISSNGATANITGVLQNTGGGGTFTKQGGGVLVLSAANTYSNSTLIQGGVIEVPSLANGGSPSPLGQSDNSAANLVLGGGALRYTGSGHSTDRLFTLTAGGTIESSGSGPVNFTNTGTTVFVGTRVNLALGGTNAGNNTLAALLADGGAGSITSISKVGSGKWVLINANTYTGTTTVTGGRLQLNVNAWTPVLSNGGADIQRGRLIFDYNGGSTPAATVLGILDAGFDQVPQFSSGKLRSSTVTDKIGLGWRDDTGAKQVTVAYTYYGDADLNGQVDVNDLGILATNWQTSQVWAGGDFDYNGTVNVNDLGLLATNWQAGVGNPLGPSFAEAAAALGLPAAAVPEPAAITLLGAIATWSLKRPGRRDRKI
jgi:fibronectin-binding autotransporter adhesin